MLQSQASRQPARAVPARWRVKGPLAQDGRARLMRCLPILGRIYAHSRNGGQLLCSFPRRIAHPEREKEWTLQTIPPLLLVHHLRILRHSRDVRRLLALPS